MVVAQLDQVTSPSALQVILVVLPIEEALLLQVK
jgi:hypothetical protein